MSDPVAESAATDPDAIGLIDAATDETWTYRDYDTAVRTTAARLLDYGIEPGDRVGLLSETRPAFAFAFFACWRIGAIAVPFNARLTPIELSEQLERVTPSLILSEDSLTGTLQTGIEQADRGEDTNPEILSFRDKIGGDVTPDSASESSATAIESTPRSTDADLASLFTSGTTGEPKAVRLTATNFRAAAAAHRDRLGVDPNERWLCTLSPYHMGGLSIFTRSACYGTTVVLQRTDTGFDPTATRDALATYGCTAVSVVPVMARRLLDDGDLPGTLRFVLSGGAPTPRQLVERATSRGVPLCPTYGMTETTSQVATPTPEDAAAHPETVGTPLPGVDVTLVDDDGNTVETGTLGEIVVSGPTVTPGYLGDSTEFDAPGFHTGDVGRFDVAGRLTVLNRREDRILTGGENVHPGEVTDVLLDHPSVEECVVLGVPDPEWGERVTALIVPTDATGFDATELESFARARLAGYKIPRTVTTVERLPRTASGTVDRNAAREQLRDLTDL